MNDQNYRVVFHGLMDNSNPEKFKTCLKMGLRLSDSDVDNHLASHPRVLYMVNELSEARAIRKSVEATGGRIVIEQMSPDKFLPFPITREHHKIIHRELLRALKGEYKLTFFFIQILPQKTTPTPSALSKGYLEELESELHEIDTVLAIDDSKFIAICFFSDKKLALHIQNKLDVRLNRIFGDEFTISRGFSLFPDDGSTVSDLLHIVEQRLSVIQPDDDKSVRTEDFSGRLSLNILKKGSSALELYQQCLISARGKKFKWLSERNIDEIWLGLGGLPKVRQKEFLFRLPVDAPVIPQLQRAIKEKRKPEAGPSSMRQIDDIVLQMREFNSHQKYHEIKQALPEKLNNVKSFPTLPKVAFKIFNIAKDPSSSTEDLTEVIKNDPALTLKLLKIVNSAFYGFPQEVETIKRAVVILGREEIKNIAFGLSLAKAIDIKPVDGLYHPNTLWHHLMGTALICRQLYRRFEGHEAPGLFTAGLLHDFGKIFLVSHYPVLYGQLHLEATQYNIPLYELEEECFGMNHALIGKYIASTWNFPEALIQAVAYHHQPFFAPDHPRLSAIVGLSDYIYHKIYSKDAEQINPGLSAGLTYGHWGLLKNIFSGISLDDLDIIIQETSRYLSENSRIFSILQ